ncbi:MAG: metal-dependent hydrolase [Candidatus Parabeggiatoa sp.]|nr:metal-dependent hydrolase [Candidatus Parabeggiatoa sp.]
MITPTHITFSQTFYLASCIFWASPASPIGAFVAMLASFIPDFDTRVSIPGRLIPNVSEWIHQHFGHRSITHAFIPQAIVWFILYVLVTYSYLSIDIVIAIAAGWFSHSCADMLTKTGVFFWYPSRRYRCVAWKNPNFRCEVMSIGEWWWGVVMFLIAVPLFFAAQSEQGAGGIIRYALADIQLAIQEYQRYKGSHAWYIDIEGTSNDDLKRIDGKYYVVDVKSSSAFYILNLEGQTVTVSSATTEDWFVSSTVLKKGEPELTTIIHLQKKEVESAKLISALDSVTKSDRLLISGKLASENLTGDIEHHKLDYVTKSELPEGIKYHAVDLKITVKHAPDIKISNLEIKSDPPTVERDEIMDRWINEALK